MLKRILVGLGGTPFTTVAIKRATELAQAHGARLTGVTVLDLAGLRGQDGSPPGADLREEIRQRIAATRRRVAETVARFETACRMAGVPFTIEQESGDPLTLMIAHARHHDLTIFGLRSLFDYGLTPDPQNALIRLVSRGVRPVLAISTQYRPIHKALMAYSGSRESAAAMRRFVQMAIWPELDMEVVTFSAGGARGGALLAAAADYCRAHGFRIETRQVAGPPDAGLLAHARQREADLIVMGNSLHNLIFRQALGDTVLATIRNADRPIFLSQ